MSSERAELAPPPSLSPENSVWKNKWAQNGLLILLAIVGVYGLIYHDVVSRARESYEQGEKYMEWYRNPGKKKEFLGKQYETDKARLDTQLSNKKISEADYRQKLDALGFDRDFMMGESSLKYAYQWYKDTYELFSPPESKWVRLARAKAPEALALWKQELKAQNIPFEDYMLE